jgi:ABC-type uncharacterized transport system permease subunit
LDWSEVAANATVQHLSFIAIIFAKYTFFDFVFFKFFTAMVLYHLPNGLHIRRTGHNPPRMPSAGWWVDGFVSKTKHNTVVVMRLKESKGNALFTFA